MASSYTASDIEVLSGLDPVRRRPGMYTDTTRPNHLAHEVIDNSVDEALAGHCDNIDVTVFKDGSLPGRGRRPRHAGRHSPEGEDQRRRIDSDAPARRRKIQRQDLPALRRTARRRRLGGQRAVEASGVLGAPRRQGIQPELRGRQADLQARSRGRRAEVEDRHDHSLLAGSEILRHRQVRHSEPQAGAARQGRAVSEPARHAHQRNHRRDATNGSTPAACTSIWPRNWARANGCRRRPSTASATSRAARSIGRSPGCSSPSTASPRATSI